MMRRLHRKVNIVVVIAKADSLTAAEVKRLKTRILNDLEEHQIQVRTIRRQSEAFFLLTEMQSKNSVNSLSGLSVP